jgi:8-oxo-dGTP pyrophosphatase MutT (NUDIX family)
MNDKISHDSEVPAQGQQVFTACAFLHKDFDGVEKVFLPKRAATKKFLPNVHELPGGHIDFGEDMIVGLKREIQEEFGVAIEVGDPFAAFTYTNEVKGSHSIEVIYFAQFADPLENITLHPEDHSEYGWYAENELDKVLNPIKGNDDPEIQVIKKGFALLRGESLHFS